ncbi:MAG: hypothetical protein OJJ54_08735 [Pseudonocardia sp.]|nr:hypothetical protein [Pseudonocardia sp.]
MTGPRDSTAPRRPQAGRRQRSAAQQRAGQWPVADRSLIASVLGIPPLAAIGVALVLTAIGVFVDILRLGTLGTIFTIAYFAGCVLAVSWVRRRSLFGPMVQPPLLLAVAVPAVVLLIGTPGPGAGATETMLMIGAPLVNGFPTMAVTTAVVLVIGVVRLFAQRTGRDDAAGRLRGLFGRGRRAEEAELEELEELDLEDERPRRAGTGTARVSSRRGSDAARGAGRTSGSPRRS